MKSYDNYIAQIFSPITSNIFNLLKIYHNIGYYFLLQPEKLKVTPDGAFTIKCSFFRKVAVYNYSPKLITHLLNVANFIGFYFCSLYLHF